MIYTNIQIHNFRGIRTCSLNELGQVNLFFGKNNCGKSSLLEALLLLSEPYNPTLPVVLNNSRNLYSVSEDDLKTDFYMADPENKINIKSEGEQKRDVIISMMESKRREVHVNELNHENSDNLGREYGYRFDFTFGEDKRSYSSELTVNEDDQNLVNAVSTYKDGLHAGYIPSSYLKSGAVEKLSEIIKSKQENNIVNALRIVEPKINDIQLVGDKIMVDVGMPTRLPINVLGDGVRKILYIILSIYTLRNGVLMIDEIDNGLHYSVMIKLWNVILKTCKETNTQLFISTHSSDIVKALVESLKEQEADAPPVSSYKLIKKDDDELVALRYGEEQLAYAVEQEIEVR